jgi:hypothetical protein
VPDCLAPREVNRAFGALIPIAAICPALAHSARHSHTARSAWARLGERGRISAGPGAGGRSGAYASVNQFQSALNDAQKCINLASAWAKGYGRKAAALVGLGRAAQAVDCFRQGLALEPDNPTLLAGLAGLVGPTPAAADATAAAAADSTPAGGVGDSASGAVAVKTEEGAATPAPAPAPIKAAPAPAPPPAPEPMDEGDLELLSEFLSEATDMERKQQAERIIKYRLNPFEVGRPPLLPKR